VESESFYQILVQGRFWSNHECILVTGKGMPDVATRACVFALHNELDLPVYGIADCNPFGAGILFCYQNGYENRFGVTLRWLGLRPSQVVHFLETQLASKTLYSKLPSSQYPTLFTEMLQEVTYLDRQKVIKQFLKKGRAHPFVANSVARAKEIEDMLRVKVDLEGLRFFGTKFCIEFFGNILEHAMQENATNELSWKDAI
jgi:hypothetical protein